MYKGRVILVQWGFILVSVLLVYRLLEVQFFYPYKDKIAAIKEDQFTQSIYNDARVNLVDRNGEHLAVSVENFSIYASSKSFGGNSVERRDFLFDYLASIGKLREKARGKIADSQTLLLASGLTAKENDYIRSLRLKGIWSDKYFRRYYPAGEAAAQLIGFVNNENQGMEGVELLYDRELTRGYVGPHVLRDGYGRFIKIIDNEEIRQAAPLQLSIDLRLQYLAYHHLIEGCRESGAKAGIIVTLDSHTGELMAVAQYPSFNPNNRKKLDINAVRNRAFTDVFEPGSTFKPLILTSILESKKYSLTHKVNTDPGYVKLSGITIRDSRNYGELSITDVIAKSSNVGISRLSQDISSMDMVNALYRLGVGRRTGSMFPGEREGYLPLTPISEGAKAVVSYGYGISLTPIQLAKAYGILANGGEDFFVSLRKGDILARERVFDEEITSKIILTMRKVVSDQGTGRNARVPGYMLAGKTGTVHKGSDKGYYRDKYIAFFVGIMPAEDLRYVTLVMLDEPQSNRYYGGEVAAPIFASYTKELFSLFNILPDSEI